MFVIKRDELMEAQDEVRELERLLNEAWLRRRNLLKKNQCKDGGTGYWNSLDINFELKIEII